MKYDKTESFQGTRLNPNFEALSFSIVLVQPETIGNVGAIARVMKNFNFNTLVLFNPKDTDEALKSHETQGFAMHGIDVLLGAQIIRSHELKDHLDDLKKYLEIFDLVIASTAKGKRHSNIRRLGIFPEHLSLPVSKMPCKIALLFGRESNGLNNDEIELADITIRIPTGNEYPTMNLSHACSVLLYELFKKTHLIDIGRGKNPVLLPEKKDRTLLYDFIQDLTRKLRFKEYTEENILFAFKNIFERAFMSKKEVRLITGFFSKFHSVLKNIDLFK